MGSVPEAKSPAQSQAPPRARPRPHALTSATCASDFQSRSPACPELAPAGNSPFALTPTSTASAPLPSRGGPLDSGVRRQSKGSPILGPRLLLDPASPPKTVSFGDLPDHAPSPF